MSESMICSDKEYLLECQNVTKFFGKDVHAVNGVSLKIKKGECYGLVGESGSGKSTLGNLVCSLDSVTSGNIFYGGMEISGRKKISSKEMKEFRKKVQMIFQDPYATLNPMHKIQNILEEPLKIHNIGATKEERLRLINEIRTLTGLPPEVLEKYPSELSGGQRQRIAIASAMILQPEFVVCDECVSALDVLVQAQILNLLRKMQKSMNLTYLFISHNLSVVAYLADRIGVMYKGQIVEEKNTAELLKNPEHPYTKSLLQAAGI